ncbi:catalytic protein [Purpureocillium lilacinum]|uniref:Catalytic protein n=1 Tax=Purpureocillium lilacinum TaxID=33203 RepID=A0A179HJA6_PURLI|nr:catalytic protein [Purpureocillium lilacinum]OAQ89493.1 catalytic protein [Purpureocillium lilacinum]
MFKSAAAILATLAAVVAAKNCRNINVPVSISARNGEFDVQAPATEIEVTNFFLNLARQNYNYTEAVLKGYKTVQGDYTLATTYCEPKDGPGDTIQILTHGVGFDRSYWDFPYNNYNYSYINKALDAKYSTLSWDRLGIGASSHGDPVNDIQIFLEVAALKALTDIVQGGKLPGVSKRYSKTVHVGHSFGSAMTFALTEQYPDISNGIVLTGFSQVPGFMGTFALGSNFAPVSENRRLRRQYAVGYVAPKSEIGVHIDFFGPDDFDPEMLCAATDMGQPAAVGELLTVGSTGMTSNFGGSVLIITGDRDVPFCGGDCTNTKPLAAMNITEPFPNLLAMSKGSFKKAKAFNATVVPLGGHGLNLGYSAGFTYNAILDFLNAEL